MAYDRHDTRHPRDERSHWREERSGNRDWDRGSDRSGGEDRGFFERAGEEISSWFGGGHDDEHERHDRGQQRRPERGQQQRDWGREQEHKRGQQRGWGREHEPEQGQQRGWGRDHDQERGGFFGMGGGGGRDDHHEDRHDQQNRGVFSRGGSSGRDYNPGGTREMWGGGDRDDFRGGGGDYRPMTGDYGRGSNIGQNRQFFAASGIPSGGFDRDHDRDRQRSQGPRDRDDYQRTSYAGSSDNFQRRPQEQDRHQHDPHYAEWRRRHMEELDSHYDEYRREHQSKFENDFGSWREQRQTKRQMLGQVREQMQVVGSDQQPVGTVERVAGDRIILAKDEASGGASYSLNCSDIGGIEGDRLILESPAEQTKNRWRNETRGRALFEREDQGSSGPHILDKSFEGTYR